jgi:UDP-N-acetylglucosamine:LPS N-acetylglucosamine transferase
MGANSKTFDLLDLTSKLRIIYSAKDFVNGKLDVMQFSTILKEIPGVNQALPKINGVDLPTLLGTFSTISGKGINIITSQQLNVIFKALGINPDKITITGIPIDPVFAEHKDKKEMRRLHSLEPDLPTILVSAGGFGMGPVEKLIQSLMKMHNRAQIIVICGKNEELKQRIDMFLRDIPAKHPVFFKTLPLKMRMRIN